VADTAQYGRSVDRERNRPVFKCFIRVYGGINCDGGGGKFELQNEK